MRTGLSAILLCILGVTASADACAAAELRSTPLFRKFGVADGLPSSSIHTLAEDHEGFIWIATVDGLARYDGTGFRIYRHNAADAKSIAGDDVTTIFIDRDDRIWCGLMARPNSIRRSKSWRASGGRFKAEDEQWQPQRLPAAGLPSGELLGTSVKSALEQQSTYI